MSASPQHRRLLADYLRAKDAQVPRLFTRVFTPDAVFVPRYAMPSPFGEAAPREGRDAVVQGFRTMGGFSENILTFVPEESLRGEEDRLHSRWVVAMTRRDTGGGFVGWGDYVWALAGDGRARRLDVGFLGLAPLSSEAAPAVLARLLPLPHPFLPTAALRAAVSDLPGLASLRAWFDAQPSSSARSVA